MALLKAGAEIDKKDVDGYLALELTPDKQVGLPVPLEYRGPYIQAYPRTPNYINANLLI